MSKEEQTKASNRDYGSHAFFLPIWPVGQERVCRYFEIDEQFQFRRLLFRFGENYIDKISDERGIRTLIQLHGKGGNFSRPIEILKLMPKSNLEKRTRTEIHYCIKYFGKRIRCN